MICTLQLSSVVLTGVNIRCIIACATFTTFSTAEWRYGLPSLSLSAAKCGPWKQRCFEASPNSSVANHFRFPNNHWPCIAASYSSGVGESEYSLDKPSLADSMCLAMFSLQGMFLPLVFSMIVGRFADMGTVLREMTAGTVNTWLQHMDKQCKHLHLVSLHRLLIHVTESLQS
jgi:hypothetical protein